jgi:hypothetical protein
MEVVWKQENSKVAKTILKMYVLILLMSIYSNHEMKEELKVLRDWIDRYNLQEMRVNLTSFLKTSKDQKE